MYHGRVHTLQEATCQTDVSKLSFSNLKSTLRVFTFVGMGIPSRCEFHMWRARHPDTSSKIAMMLSLDHGHLECAMLLSSVGTSCELEQNGHKWLAHEVAFESEQPRRSGLVFTTSMARMRAAYSYPSIAVGILT